MKRLMFLALVLVATGCGSTGTEATGADDDDDGSSQPFNCGSFLAGPGIICDTSTTPPTIRVDFGTGENQAVPGNDPRIAAVNPDKGKYIASFTPAVGTEAISGMLIKNPATGKIGIKAADELCKAKNPTYPSAHMCSTEEILWNVRHGHIGNGQTGIAFAMYQDPGLGGTRDSFRASCGGLTYNSADLSYTGTTWNVVASDPKNQSPGDDTVDALAVNFAGGVACTATNIPIACCQ